jgi:hypothetical protein
VAQDARDVCNLYCRQSMLSISACEDRGQSGAPRGVQEWLELFIPASPCVDFSSREQRFNKNGIPVIGSFVLALGRQASKGYSL